MTTMGNVDNDDTINREIDSDDEFYNSAEYYDIHPKHLSDGSRYDDNLSTTAMNPQFLSTSPPRKSVVARVKSTFIASNDEELSVTENDEIEIRDMDETPWGLGRRLSDGKQGWFPMECLEQSQDIVHAIESSKKSVDDSSLVAQKTETKAHLANRLTIRPTRAELQQHNILPNSDASPALQDAQKQLDMKKKGDFLSNFFRARKKEAAVFDSTSLTISKDEITFGKSDFDANEVLHDSFEIRNLSNHKAKWLIEWELNDATHVMQSISLHFEPSKGSVSKHKSQTVKVSLELKNGAKAKDITAFLIVGGKRLHTFIVKTKSKFGVFGVDPSTIDFDIDADNDLCVPAILIQLKECIKSRDGFRKEGIFRISGNSNTVDSLKKQMNARLFMDSNDVYSIANLIKIWYRDLPTPALQSLTRDQLFEEDPEKCVQAVLGLPDPHLSLIMWLIDLIIVCASYQSESKMGVENLAIVIAPNLYQPDKSVDAMEGLIRTQKINKFLQYAVTGIAEHKKNGTLPKIVYKNPMTQKQKDMEADRKLRLMHGLQQSRRRSQSVNDLRKPPLPTKPKPSVLPKPNPLVGSNTIHIQSDKKSQSILHLQTQLEKQMLPNEEVLRSPGMRKATLGGNPPVPTYIRMSNDSKSNSTGSTPSISPSSSPSKNSPALQRKNTYHPTGSFIQDANKNKK